MERTIKTTAKFVNELEKEKNRQQVSNYRLSVLTGFSRSTIKRIFDRTVKPDADTLFKIAEKLQITVHIETNKSG